ncbi:MAG: hypothetical protein OEW35_12020 [Gammaproteobacteria bacterium]|nr:hypothetical protein [Gammaproteobacteria bacterium]MDH4254831.1 hypothetical protein [Gammaproteobacteria bacterium]
MPAFGLLLMATAGVFAAEREFESIVYPAANATVTSATGINSRGDIVGQYRQGAGPTSVLHGFLLDRHGQYASIDHPGAVATNAWGIGSTGAIAGDYRVTSADPILGFVLSDGNWTTIDCEPTLGAVHTFAFGVNASGEVAGEYKLSGVPLQAPGRAFLYRDGECIDITPPVAGGGASVAVAWAISDAGDTVGYYNSGGVLHGWVRDRHGAYSMLDHPDGASTNLRGVNASGEIVGLYRDTASVSHGFHRDGDGAFTTLDYPAAAVQRALGVNARGDVVGDYSGADCAAARCAWVWRRSTLD